MSSQLEAELSKKKICRFCLVQNAKLASIYVENSRIKASAALPLQIMAITSIEVNKEDGLPGFICLDCHLLFEYCYRFKQMCKRADTLLRQFPLTGHWPAALPKPRAPPTTTAKPDESQQQQQQQPKKLLNSMAKTSTVSTEHVQVIETSDLPTLSTSAVPVKAPEPSLSVPRPSSRRSDPQSYQRKLEDNQVLSMDDVQNLMADIANELGEEPPSPVKPSPPPPPPAKPKVLNKSSPRILNKGANTHIEPRLATPQIKRDEAGNVAIVTEIITPSEPIEARQQAPPAVVAETVDTNVFPCRHCERTFPLQQLRDIHMANHSRTRAFQCPDCEKSFFSKYDLQKHSYVHSGERPFKCAVCQKGFTRGALLQRHERTHTDIPKFICVYCEKPFICREEMEKHVARHTKKRPFQCGVCGKAFAFKQGLERHEVVHCTDLPHSCHYCNQSFATAGKLARHVVGHAGKRAYPCKYCPKSYLLSHHLSRHLRTHKQGHATFECCVCKDSHETYHSLVDHSLIHASATLSCPLCLETIADIELVEGHIQAHRDGASFACEFCDTFFLNAAQLHKHIDDDHVMDMVPYQTNEGEEEQTEEDDVRVKAESDEMLLSLLKDEEEEDTEGSPSPLKVAKVVSPAEKPSTSKRALERKSAEKQAEEDSPQRQTRSRGGSTKPSKMSMELVTKHGRVRIKKGKGAPPK